MSTKIQKAIQLNAEVKQHLQASYENAGHSFTNLLHMLPIPPLYSTLRINVLADSKENALRKVQQEIEKQYRCKQRCCNTSVIPEYSNVTSADVSFSIQPPKANWHPVLSDVLVIPSRGPRMCIQLPNEVIVDLTCGMAVLRGAHVFAQGIMAAGSGMQSGDKVSVYADVSGSCKKGLLKKFDDERLFVGNGISQISRKELFCSDNKISGVGILMTESIYDAVCLSNMLPDIVFAQNLPSIVCGHVLNPQPGECILDMCAAPGGKTTHIATLMRDTGTVFALDKGKQKIPVIDKNVQNWHIKCVKIFSFDGTKSCVEEKVWDNSPPFPPASFDRILLDVPCSALGQRPSVFNSMQIKQLQSYPKYQRKLFSEAVKLLKPGGTLVYSTCTVTLDENEGMAAWALKEFDEINLVPQSPHLGGNGFLGTSLAEHHLKYVQRFDPSRIDSESCDSDTVGFFIAKFVKTKQVLQDL